MKTYLSKSSYCKCVQCEKILWLSKYKKDNAVAENKGSVFETGNEVGELAKGLFGDYVDIPFDKKLSVRIEKTQELLQDKPNVITEASFIYDNNFCNVVKLIFNFLFLFLYYLNMVGLLVLIRVYNLLFLNINYFILFFFD